VEAPPLGKDAAWQLPTTHSGATRPSCASEAIRLVFETIEEEGRSFGVITRIARQLGIGSESLRLWVRQAEVDRGERPGTSTTDAERIAALERENRELRRANEILKSASAFFARELDPRPPG
jgi:transposase